MSSEVIQRESLSTVSVRRRFSAHVAWTLAVRILMAVNSVAASIIVARWLGADGLGKLSVLNVTTAMAVQTGSLGLPSSSVYFIAQDNRRLAPVAINSFTFALVAGGLLALSVYIAALQQPGLFGPVSPSLVRLPAISIPFQLISLLGLNIFLALGRIGRFNLLELMGQTFIPINAVLVLLVLRSGLWTLVALNTAANVALSILIVFSVAGYAAEQGDGARRVRPDLSLFKSMLGYGLKFHVAALAGIIIFRADLLIVNHFRGAGEAGVYAVASQVSLMLMLLPGVIATLLFPRIASGQDLKGQTICRVARHTAFVMLLVCALVAPLSFTLPLFYGAGFADVAVQLLILLPGVYLVSIESVMVQHFNAAGLPRAIPLFWVATLVVNLALTLALVPALGARGAGLASTLSYAMIFALVAYYFRKRTGQPLSEALLLRGYEVRELFAAARPVARRHEKSIEEAGNRS